MARRQSLPGLEDLPLLLQAEEVAAILRVSRKAHYMMVERGEIPHLLSAFDSKRLDELTHEDIQRFKGPRSKLAPKTTSYARSR